MIVCKFGGSSVADASQIFKVREILMSDSRRRLIVVSAPGKRNNSDEKITDILYRCHDEVAEGNKAGSFKIIRARYTEICNTLGIDSISTILDEVESGIEEGRGPDYAASRGEYLAAKMLSGFFGAEFIDAAEVIRLTSDGRIEESSYTGLKDRIKGDGLYILPGFYGSDPDGNIKTFSRGGSDITGAIAARAVNAEVYENWTDVSGLLMADPRIVRNPVAVPELTYKEIRELASIGANVFHEEAVTPVKDHNIPINIRNTNDPDAPGTFIVADRDYKKKAVVGVSGKTSYTNIFIEKLMLNRYPGFRERFLELLGKAGIVPEFESRGFDSISFLVSDKQINSPDTLLREIADQLKPDLLEIRESFAVIGIVGSGVIDKTGIAAAAFSALSKENINIRFISFGGSELTLLLGIDAAFYRDALTAIYKSVGNV